MSPKAAPAPAREPQIGDVVLCDGEFLTVVGWAKDEAAIRAQAAKLSKDPKVIEAAVALTLRSGGLMFENERVRRLCQLTDLRFDAEAEAWYLWGRCLSHEQTETVKLLRDRDLIPARATRQRGAAPAGGEHLNLWLALFKGRPASFWTRQLASLEAGDPMPADGAAAIEDYRRRYALPLTRGYADPDVDDSPANEADVQFGPPPTREG